MMLKKWIPTTSTLIAVAALGSALALAQDAPAPKPKRAPESSGYHQFDLGASAYKTFVSNTTGMGFTQTPSDGLGGLAEARYLISPLVGFEMAVMFGTGGQTYTPLATGCQLTCQNPKTIIGGRQVEASLDYVPSIKIGNLRPFLVGGLGVFVSVPDSTPLGNNTSIRGAYVYGGGLDYNITRRIGVRGQFRGTMYKAPNISSIYPADGQYTQTLTPMGGIFWRF